MNAINNISQPLQMLKNWDPLPRQTLTAWLDVAERHGFNAILPLIQMEGVDIVNRILRHSAVDLLFLLGVNSWRRALLLGSDLGAPVDALKDVFQELIVVEPNPLLYRLLAVRFKDEIAAGRVRLKAGTLTGSDVDLDLLWFMPTIGRAEGCLPLTAEVRAILQDCTRRLAPGGVHLTGFIRDRGLLQHIALPGIRREPGRGYSLRKLEEIFRLTAVKEQSQLDCYWVNSARDGRISGTKLDNQAAIAYCIRRASRSFNWIEPFGDSGANFVATRVSSLMLAVRKKCGISPSCAKPRLLQGKVAQGSCVVHRAMRTVREEYEDYGKLVPVLFRSGSMRQGSRAMYLLLDSDLGCPKYIVRIAKSKDSELRLRNEAKAYQSLRESNAALRSLESVRYVISPSTEYSVSAKTNGNGISSFSVERFVDGVSGAAFAQHVVLDTYSFDWLFTFQGQPPTVSEGLYDNDSLCAQVSDARTSLAQKLAAVATVAGVHNNLGSQIAEPVPRNLFDSLEERYQKLPSFSLPLTPVHGDFCAINLIAYDPCHEGNQRREVSARTSLPRDLKLHVFDWEYLHLGAPLFDPWLYVIGGMHLSMSGRTDIASIGEYLTGMSRYSERTKKCLLYYSKMSRVPPEVLCAYLPLALLTGYMREAGRYRVNAGAVALFKTALTFLAGNAVAVWQYLDRLTNEIEKEF